ncbi:MAG: hypothetical protein V3V75_06675 [Thermoguttaceae bacterium]
MPALIRILNPAGKLLASCDSRCYNSTSEFCSCLCQKANHGQGIRQAAKNVRDNAHNMCLAWAMKHPELKPGIVALHKKINEFAHPVLFEKSL